MSNADFGVNGPKRPRKRFILAVIAGLLILAGASAGGLAWFNADQTSQEQARVQEAQRVKDEAAAAAAAAAAKKAASDAYWAKAQADDRQRKADASAKDAAAAAGDLAAKGWKKAATDIYTADIPGGYRCTRLACNQFLVMTTAQSGCPRGIVIRGRWLQGGVVTGPVTEITGPVLAGEQAAVEVLDYTGSADSLDLTEFRCT